MSIRTKYTKTEQRNIINRGFAKVRNGHSITSARKTVAKEVKVSVNTLSVWQNKLNMKTPTIIKTTDLVRNNGLHEATKVVTKSSTGAIQGLENMKGQLGIVFTSLVNQDGRFTNPDASAISGTASVILGCCKQVLLERKAIAKSNLENHYIK